MSRLAILVTVVALAATCASADIIDWNCAPDGDGAITMGTPVWTEMGGAEYKLEMGGNQYWYPAHVQGDFTADSNDPTVWIIQTIENDTDFAWTDYHIAIGMTHSFSITGVVAPDNWTWNITAPVAGTIPNGGGAGYVGLVDYYQGTGNAIPNGVSATGDFGLIVNFVGSIAYSTEQVPTPEPATMGMLAIGALLVLRRRR